MDLHHTLSGKVPNRVLAHGGYGLTMFIVIIIPACIW